jgi:heat shock protein HtpX
LFALDVAPGVRSRFLSPLVGLVVLAVYTAASLAGFAVVRWLVAHPPGLFPAAFAFVGGVVVAAYAGYRAGTVRLVASLQARELPRNRAPELYRRLDRLDDSMRAGRPPLLVADLGAPNALSAGGPRRGAVILDRSLLGLLTVDELEGVLAHELAHLERYDTFLNTLAVTVMRTIAGVVFLLLLPVVLFLAGIDRAAGWFAGRPGARAGLVAGFRRAVTVVLGVAFSPFALAYLAYSRRQEYAADRRAVEATGRPAALARGLVKIQRARDPRSGLFSLLYTHEERTDRPELLSTHPPLDRRIDRLRDRAETAPRQAEPIQLGELR